jgi:hypothetical protein
MVRTVSAIRYVTPLREGGSLPAIVEADDDGTYVLKFRGAGQGPRVLVAELVAGEIARALGLPVPEIVFVEVDPGLGRNEPDSEIRALLKASLGKNLALDYLPGSLAYDPAASAPLDPLLASRIVWFDAYVFNIDRTARNTNMLVWHGQPWLIDHGAAFYFQHGTNDYRARSQSPFPAIRQHVLLPLASRLGEADATSRARLGRPLLESIVSLIPDAWLADDTNAAQDDPPTESPAALRAAYLDHLVDRLAASALFVEEVQRARAEHV